MQQSTREVTDGLLSIGSIHYGDEVVIVSFSGELDLAVLPTAAAAIDEGFATGAQRIVLDLQKLEFLDSSGIALLNRVAARDAFPCEVLVIPSDSPGVSRVLAVTGVDSLLRFATEPHSVTVV
jgi:anti-sigma B factor antagonist